MTLGASNQRCEAPKSAFTIDAVTGQVIDEAYLPR